MRWLTVLCLLASLTAPLAAGGCRRSHGRAKVAVSVFPVYDLVRRIAGPDADVSLVLPPGVSPHQWTPTEAASTKVANANLVVAVGLGLDPWMDALEEAAAPKARILKVGDRVPTIAVEGGPVKGGAIDGHVWMDPARARLIATAIAEDLARTDSSHASAFRDRASTLDASLEALDSEVEARVAGWSSRAFVTFHASMGYYAERYGLKVVGVVERTPGVEPTGEERDALIATIYAFKLRALLSEPQLSPAPVESVSRETHLPISPIDPLGGTAATATYEDLIRFDTVELETLLR